MSFQFGKLLRNLRRKVGLETALLHDFFCGGLQVKMRRIGVVHELPVGYVRWIQAITRGSTDAGASGGGLSRSALWKFPRKYIKKRLVEEGLEEVHSGKNLVVRYT